MHLTVLAEMAGAAMADRTAVGGITYGQLLARRARAATTFASHAPERIGLIDENSEAVPVALFGAAFAGLPYVPLNYRLADDQLRALLARIAPALVVVGPSVPDRVGAVDGIELVTRAEFLAATADQSLDPASPASADPDDVAVLLFTSGTTGEPKAAVLRHKHLTAYVLSTVEFMSAAEDEAAVVSVPPYHVAGISAVLTGLYAGRRIVYLDAFEPEQWVRTVREEAVTHAMVVPTMLGRILDVVERSGGLPTLRHVSYGGGRMPLPVIERAMTLLPSVGWVNAYGLTETSSTIALLGPDDHRTAFAGTDPAVRARLGSVGRPLPTVDLEIRDGGGGALPPGHRGEIWVRGEQVSGEYVAGAVASEGGWFPTRDAGWVDGDGYLYVDGRLDDVIVRGAENLSPGEIEDVLLDHPAVAAAAVVGIPDDEWGEAVVAAVVRRDREAVDESELQAWVGQRLRSSRTPKHVAFRDELPFNETGKLLRRQLRQELADVYC